MEKTLKLKICLPNSKHRVRGAECMWNFRNLTIMWYFALFGCSRISEKSPVASTPDYVFEGIQSLTEGNEGKWMLKWNPAPFEGSSYFVFKRLSTEKFDFSKPSSPIKDNFFVTEDLRFAGKNCFVVRFSVPGYKDDTNVKELCTTPEKIDFAGVDSVQRSDAGKVSVSWKPHPKARGKYQVTRAKNDGSLEAKPLVESGESQAQVGPFPLAEELCFHVRYFEPDAPQDENNVVKCVDDNRLTDFVGVEKGFSVETGSAVLEWTPSSHPLIAGYNIYQGSDFKTRIGSIAGKDKKSIKLTELPAGKEFVFGVRAYTSFGMEDLNGKTVGILVKDLNAPQFGGIVSAGVVNKTTISVKWNPGVSVGKYKVHGVGVPVGQMPNMNWSTLLAEVPGSSTSVDIPDLQDDSEYVLGVRAVNAFGIEEQNIQVLRVTTQDSGAPKFSGVESATIDGEKITIRWNKAVGEVTRYRIFRAKGSASQINFASSDFVSEPGSASFTLLSGFQSFEAYSFAVRAEDRYGNIDQNTKVVTVNVGKQSPPRFLGYQAVTANSETELDVSFFRTPDTNIAYYKVIVRKPGSTAPIKEQFVGQPPSGIGVTSKITGLQSKTTYEILVKPVDVYFNLGDNETTIAGQTLDTTPPSFDGIRSVTQNRGRAEVRWGSLTTNDIKGYVVYWSEEPMDQKILSLTQPLPVGVFKSDKILPNLTSYSVAGLRKEITYYFKVQAFDEFGNEDRNQAQYSLRIANSAPDLLSNALARDTFKGVPSAVITLTASDTDAYDTLEFIELSTTCPPSSLPVKTDSPQVDGTRVARVEWTPSRSFLPVDVTQKSCQSSYRVSDGTTLSGSLFITFTVVDRQPKNLSAQIAIRPGGFSRSEGLTCNASAVDDDADELTIAYSWRRNGLTIAGANTNTLDPMVGNFTPDSVIQCAATISDGHVSQVQLSNSATFTNLPPVSPVASALDDDNNGNFLASDFMRCSYSATDPDNDTLVFGDVTLEKSDTETGSWSPASIAKSSCPSGTPLSTCFQLNRTLRSKFLRCRVAFVKDLFSDPIAPFYSNAKQVLNSDPIISSVSLAPTTGLKLGTVLTCSETHLDPDGDALPPPTFTWSRDGNVIAGQSSGVYSLTQADRDKFVKCAVSYPANVDGAGSQAVGPIESSSVIYRNTDPVISSVTLSPLTNVKFGDTLTCAYTTQDPDGEPDATSVASSAAVFTWRKSGEVIPGATSATYLVKSTDRSQPIRCEVSLPENADGRGSQVVGPVQSSSLVTPVNQSPVISTPVVTYDGILTPVPAKTGMQLTCSAVTSDPDGDSLPAPSYIWKRNGTVVASTTNPTYSLVSADRGTNITCTLNLPFNADGNQSPSVSSAPSNAIQSVNSSPTISSVSTSSVLTGDQYPGYELRCASSISDLDGDSLAVQYQWYRGANVIASAVESRYFATAEDRDQNILCGVTLPANADGKGGQGSSMTSVISINIKNRAPKDLTASVSPNTIYRDSVLTCSYSAVDDDSDVLSYSVSWQKNGVTVGGQSGTTLNVNSQSPVVGDSWKCTVQVSDSIASAQLASSSVVVQNRPPYSVSAPTLGPSTVYNSDLTNSLSCTGGFADDDGDSLTTSYRWFKGGAVLANTSGNTLSAGSGITWARNDILSCMILVNDGQTGGSNSNTSGSVVVANKPPYGTLRCGGQTSLVVNAFPGETISAVTCNGVVDDEAEVPTYFVSSSTCSGGGITPQGVLSGVVMDTFDCSITVGAVDGNNPAIVAPSVATIEYKIPFNLSFKYSTSSSCLVTATMTFLPQNLACNQINSDFGELLALSTTDIWQSSGSHTPQSGGQCTATATRPLLSNPPAGSAKVSWTVTASNGVAKTKVQEQVIMGSKKSSLPGIILGNVVQEGLQPDPIFDPSPSPKKALGCSSDACSGFSASIGVGGKFTCTIANTGKIYCWGARDKGQLGNNEVTTSSTTVPKAVAMDGFKALSVAVSSSTTKGHACAIFYNENLSTPPSSGSVYCWGANDLGQLGDGTFTQSAVPRPVNLGDNLANNPSTPFLATSISLGQEHSCAVLEGNTPASGGGLRCWGKNDRGQLGDSSNTNSEVPTGPNISNSGSLYYQSGVMAVITGNYHTCFLSPAGTVSCFGGGNLGQLGNGSLSNSLSPVSVSGLTDVGALAAGDDFSCALKKAGLDQGKIFCWGSNIKGQLGTGDYSVRSSPNLVSNLGSIASISAGNNHVCAVKNDGVGYCWGDNTFGQIGDGYTLSSGNLEPTLVSGLGNDARMLVAGGNHSCVLKPGGEIMCYGQNIYFQLGASGSILKPSLKAFPPTGFPNTRYLNCPSYFVYSTE